eukprot:9338383-Pyramimonas_sp.AAC.1
MGSNKHPLASSATPSRSATLPQRVASTARASQGRKARGHRKRGRELQAQGPATKSQQSQGQFSGRSRRKPRRGP